MSKLTRRLWIVAALLTTVALANIALQVGESKPYGAVHARTMPMVIGDWAGEEMALDKRTIEILETDDVLLRSYVRAQEKPIWLCIVFSENNRKIAHPPEVCYAGAGWHTELKEVITPFPGEAGLGELCVVKLLIANANERQVVLYWYKTGKKHTASYYGQQLNMMRDQLTKRKSSGALIRVSVFVEGNDVEGAFTKLRVFTRATMPHIEACLP